MSLRVCLDKATGLHCLVDDSNEHQIEDANKFLAALVARGLSPRTIRSYGYDILDLYRWLQPRGQRFEELRESDLLDFVSSRLNKGISARAINRRLVVSRALYLFVTGQPMLRGKGVSLPASHYRGRGRDRNIGLHLLPCSRHLSLRVKVPRTLIEPLTTAQVRSFLRSLRRYRDLGIVYLMLLCGLRSREVLCLRLSDLSMGENRLRVRGKGGKDRVMPVPDTLLETIESYLGLERPSQCPTERLFVVLQGKRRGRPMSPEGLRSLFRRRRARRFLLNANPHRFRHTFGTDMARAGVRLPVLQKMLGHAHAQTTLQYINLSMADIADEYQRAMKHLGERYKADHRY